MAVTMKYVVIWDVSLRDSCTNLRFRGTYRLHLQCENSQQTKNILAVARSRSTL
jgi:hypothetical protein